ncbi:MAG: hypothetical protein CMB48_00620 [Euryarchaeota archaeon]|nr:hypothetical protein [Euryarchaeota archaeon]|tara:strand:- start:8483 stop:8851 length:369 start_codon:yes stop_codon:yes gene_type:complete
MGEVIDVSKTQNRIFLTLILSILASIYVGLNYTLIQGYYLFAILFLGGSAVLMISNLEIMKTNLEFSASKVLYVIVFILSIFVSTSVFNNNWGFPLMPSIGLSVICFLFVSWVYYSLEPLRG